MRFTALFGWLVTVPGIAGCSPGQVATTVRSAPVRTADGPSAGRILALRHVLYRGAAAGFLPPDELPTGPGTTTATEFIVRTDDGATLSIVQANEAGWRPGDRVLVLHGEASRLVSPG